MQYVAVCCSVLQCLATVCCNVSQCVAVCCGVLRCVAVCCGVLRCVAVRLCAFRLMRLAGERSYVYISVRRNRDTHSSKNLYQILQRYRHIFQESISNITYVQTYTPRIYVEYYIYSNMHFKNNYSKNPYRILHTCVNIHSKNLCRILRIYMHMHSKNNYSKNRILPMYIHALQESMSNITYV